MGYYTIRIYPSRQDTTTIVTEFRNLIYNRLPMGMRASGDIFQAKLDELLGDIKAVKTYIDNILVLSKDWFRNHIEKLIMIFGRLCAAGLKVNTPKCSFGLKEITYLGYVMTREVVEPDSKKVQGIMDTRRLATTTEAPALIGMVQYYRDIWTRRSHVLAPLKEADNGPKGRRILWNDALESYFKELKCMGSADKLLSYPDWKLP